MEEREKRQFREGERAYILNDDSLPFYMGEGLGDLDYKDAIDLSIIRRTEMGLPATRDYINAVAPPPEGHEKELRDYSNRAGNTSHHSRPSKNNPYVCIHCDYKSTRYGNMITHLRNSHGDYTTDPRDNR